MPFQRLCLAAALVFTALAACDPPRGEYVDAPDSAPAAAAYNILTAAEIDAGWRLLFDGESTRGWRGTYQEGMPEERWAVEDGMLMIIGEAGGGGAIITEEQFEAFELALSFKIEEGANSGIKYFVVEDYEPTPGRGLGLEYQIWDDSQPRDADKTMAALYDLIPAEGKQVRPLGEWNDARIVVRGDSVEHWLNGDRVVDYVRGSEEFDTLIEGSKYRDIEGFGLHPRGHILLQDEGGHRVWFRDIKIREF